MSFDHLNLGKDDKVRKILQEQSDTIYDEIILYSNRVTKINRKAKSQQRVLIITDKAIYNFTPLSAKKRSFSIRNIFTDAHHSAATPPPSSSSSSASSSVTVDQLKRRISIEDIYIISVSTNVHEVVLHVPTEYDYLYRCAAQRDVEQIVRTLQSTATAMGHSIKSWSFQLNSLSEISENAKTKGHSKETQQQYVDSKVTEWKQKYNIKEYDSRSRSLGSIVQKKRPESKRKHFKSRSAMVFGGIGDVVGSVPAAVNRGGLGGGVPTSLGGIPPPLGGRMSSIDPMDVNPMNYPNHSNHSNLSNHPNMMQHGMSQQSAPMFDNGISRGISHHSANVNDIPSFNPSANNSNKSNMSNLSRPSRSRASHLSTTTIPLNPPMQNMHSGSSDSHSTQQLHPSIQQQRQSAPPQVHQQHYRQSASHGALQFNPHEQYQMQMQQMQMFQAMNHLSMSNMNAANGFNPNGPISGSMNSPMNSPMNTAMNPNHNPHAMNPNPNAHPSHQQPSTHEVPPPLLHARSVGSIHHTLYPPNGVHQFPGPQQSLSQSPSEEDSQSSYSSGSSSGSYSESEDEEDDDDDDNKENLPQTNVYTMASNSTDATIPMNPINQMGSMGGPMGTPQQQYMNRMHSFNQLGSVQLATSRTRLTPDVSPTGSGDSVSPHHSPLLNAFAVSKASHSSLQHSPLDSHASDQQSNRNGSLMSTSGHRNGSLMSNHSVYSNQSGLSAAGSNGPRYSNGFTIGNGKRFSNQSCHSSASGWSQSNQSLGPAIPQNGFSQNPNRNSHSQHPPNRRQMSRSSGVPRNFSVDSNGNKVINMSHKQMPSKPLPALNRPQIGASSGHSNHSNISNQSNGFTKSVLGPTAEEIEPVASDNDTNHNITTVSSIAEAQQLDVENKEDYLTDSLFWEAFKMTKTDFQALRPWKQRQLKKDAGLC